MTYDITASLIAIAVGVLVPGLTSLVTRSTAGDGLKALLSGMLAALGGGLSGALTSTPHGWGAWQAILWPIGIAWLTAGIAYVTGWKPTGASTWLESRTKRFGIGPKWAPEHLAAA